MFANKDKWLFLYDREWEEIVIPKLALLQSRLQCLPMDKESVIQLKSKKPIFIALRHLTSIVNLRIHAPLVIFYNQLNDLDMDLLAALTQDHSIFGVFPFEKVFEVLHEYFNNFESLNSMQSEGFRKTNRFTQRVSKLESLSELLVELREDMRAIKKVGGPLLLLNYLDEGLELLFFQTEKVCSVRIKQSLSWDTQTRHNAKQDRQLLAMVLGRPIAKVLAIPIISGIHPVTLFIEHDLTEKEMTSFMHFINQRLQIIETILDVLLIERRLNKASQLWEKTFESLSDPVAIIDKNYNLLRGNKKFRQYPENKKCYKVFFNLSQPCQNCPIYESHSQQQVSVTPLRVHNSSYEVHSSPIFLYRQQDIAGYAHHYIDQTETLVLKGRIVQSEKMAAMGHLAGNIAHELNNPLTGIRSLAQLLIAEMESDSSLAQDLIEVEKAASRCQKIITNLLDYTKEQQGELNDVSLNEIVDKTIPMLKSALRPFNLHIEHNMTPVIVKANEQMLQQVLFNIILNATQAMHERGDIRVVVDMKQGEALLRVVDNGPGIPQDLQKQVFEPFFTTKEKGQGTGLGLSMVKKVVESFQGKVLLKSHEQEGTELSLHFPVSSS